MTTQLNFLDDELDLSTLESGNKKKYAKTIGIPDGKSAFRILPAPKGKDPLKEVWYNWLKFNEVSEDGEPKQTFATVRAATRDNPIKAKQEAVASRLAELEGPYATTSLGANGQGIKKVDESKMPAEVAKEYKKLKHASQYLRSTRHIFANAVTLDGQHIILRMPKTAADMVRKELIRLKTEGETLNPLSFNDSEDIAEGKTVPSFGVWFDFERSGEGLQTKYAVKVRKTRQKVKVNGQNLVKEEYDHTPVDESVKATYSDNYVDLDTFIPIYTNDELTLMLKGDRSPVEAKRGFAKTAATADKAVKTVAAVDPTAGLSLSDDEVVAQEDDIPMIDL